MTPEGGEEYALILEKGSPRLNTEIARVLALHLPVHPTDAILGVRYGGGLVARRLAGDVAEEILRSLLDIGVRARKIEDDRWAMGSAERRVIGLEALEEGLRARMVTGRTFLVPHADVFGVHVYGLARPPEPEEVVLPGARRRRKAAPWKPPPASLAGGAALSPRGRKVLESMAETGSGPLDLHLDVLCREPHGVIRIRKDDFDYSCLGESRLEHSLDNFLILLDNVLSRVPGAWHGDEARRFLEDLDARRILYFKEEEANNVNRWILQWARIEEETGSAAEGEPR